MFHYYSIIPGVKQFILTGRRRTDSRPSAVGQQKCKKSGHVLTFYVFLFPTRFNTAPARIPYNM